MDYVFHIIDQIIAGTLVCAVGTVITGWLLFRQSLRFCGLLLVTAGLVVGTVALYATFIEPSTVIVRHVTVDLADYTGTPLRIAVMSDPHVDAFSNGKTFEKAVELVGAEDDLDAAVLLGDYVRDRDGSTENLSVLTSLAHTLPTYYITGNHDFTLHDRTAEPRERLLDVDGALLEAGALPLDNTSTTLHGGDDSIILAGVRDIWSQDYSFSDIGKTAQSNAVILLCHNPDGVLNAYREMANPSNIDFMISGHTHGGEVRLPLVGAVYPLPIELPQTYDEGFHIYRDIDILITSGLGSVGTRLRFLNPPEIVILTVQ
ncbi:MAG: metallophosphoesterase [Candidatus Dojkabacteria bacterium]|nr:metallophosphoesterase [Candidatus Dojkabacteria bacterium]